MHFNLPQSSNSPIKVIGVGGGSSNAVNTMFQKGIKASTSSSATQMPRHWTSVPFHAKCSSGPHSQVGKAQGHFLKWARTPRLKAWTKC